MMADSNQSAPLLPFEVDLYTTMKSRWPTKGRHILATFDDDKNILYQAYKTSIAEFAVENQTLFGCPEFNPTRMTWFKPNFLWMMHRSGWASKHNQTNILAILIRREDFEEILRNAKSTHNNAKGRARRPGTTTTTKVKPVPESESSTKQRRLIGGVRFQWDPDHSPQGDMEYRRAIQLGVKGRILNQLMSEWILDITEFVHEQRRRLVEKSGNNGRLDLLHVPKEAIYNLQDSSLAARIELDGYPPQSAHLSS